ncbi:MAG TPA: DUF1440 domain-containing protein, partial [Thermoanaerobaculia bacterium]|nr:DUF1440 domain-containing protein [Thermoanaerobaculia bacterium]
GKTTTYLYERESKPVRRREDRARGGKTAYEIAAEKTAALAGRRLSPAARKQLGQRLHWGIGILSGILYSVLRRNRTDGGLVRGLGAGALFGTGVWLLVDEAANVALGLTPAPAKFPWQAHARGLAGHLVLGMAAEGVLQAANRAA